MTTTIFKIIFWIGMAIEIVIRAPFQRTYKASTKAARHVSRTEQILLGLLSVSLVFPLLYTLTPWLNFANYTLPTWMGWLGGVLLALAVFIFARAHRDLKAYWSPSLEIFQGHSLMTEGIYHYIRHPMYASQWVWSIAQILLLQNWLAGPSTLVVFIPFYFLRVRAEEKMMLETFGDQYREYMKTTGWVIPKF
jgi:protein-S-isoprenylcysteine O-methyltransferase Ste14